MPANLFIAGKDFNVDHFLMEIKLSPYRIFHKGDKPKTKSATALIDYSGCNFNISNADFNDFRQQGTDAIDFLKQSYDDLKKLQDYPLDFCNIDIGVSANFKRSNTNTFYLTRELVTLCGELGIGIEVSVYDNIAAKH